MGLGDQPDREDWHCANCGERSGMQGHFSPTGFTCEPLAHPQARPVGACPDCSHPWTMHSTDPTTVNRCSFGKHLLGCQCERVAPPSDETGEEG